MVPNEEGSIPENVVEGIKDERSSQELIRNAFISGIRNKYSDSADVSGVGLVLPLGR